MGKFAYTLLGGLLAIIGLTIGVTEAEAAQAQCPAYATSARSVTVSPYTIQLADQCALIVVKADNATITVPPPGSKIDLSIGYTTWVVNNTLGNITFAGTINGVVNPVIPAGASLNLYTDGANWYGVNTVSSVGAGTGDVLGPAGAVADNVVSFNGGTGKAIKDSGIAVSSLVPGTRTITGAGLLAGGGDLTANRTITFGPLAATSLLGNSTGSSAVPVAIPLGANMSFVGGALTSTGSGSGSPTLSDTHGNTITTPTSIAFAAGTIVGGVNGGAATVKQTSEAVDVAGSTYTVGTTSAGTNDANLLLHFTNGTPVTVTLLSGATVGAGWGTSFKCDAGCTINRAGSDTVNGATSMTVAAEQTASIWRDGTATSFSGAIVPATDPSNASNLISGTVAMVRGGSGASTLLGARTAFGIDGRTTGSDTSVVLTTSDYYITTGTVNWTVPATWTLPATTTVNDGRPLEIADASFVLNGNTLTVAAAGGDALVGNNQINGTGGKLSCRPDKIAAKWTCYSSIPNSASTGQFLLGLGTTTPPTWVTPGGDITAVDSSGNVTVGTLKGYTFPSGAATNKIIYGTGAFTYAGMTPVNGAVVNTNSSGVPAETITPVLGVAATSSGTLGLANGAGGGAVVTLQSMATSAWNFNLPPTAGTTGQVLTSQGGGSTAMTWATPAGGGNVTGSGASTIGDLLQANNTGGTLNTTTSTGIAAANVVTAASNLTSNALSKGNGSKGEASSTVTDDGTTVTVPEAFALSGVITPTALVGTTSDYAPAGIATATRIELDPGNSGNALTGITTGLSGRRLTIYNSNAASGNLTISNNVTSSAGNRFILPGDIIIKPKASRPFIWSTAANGWTLEGAALENIVTAGTVGSATAIPVITYGADGRITGTTTAAPTSIMGSVMATVAASSTRFSAPYGTSGSTVDVFSLAPRALTFKNINLITNVDIGSGQTVTVTPRKNGVDQAALACVVTGTGSAGAKTNRCVADVSYAQGDQMSYEIIATAVTGSPFLGITIEYQ